MTDPLILVVEDNRADFHIIEEAIADVGPAWPTYRLQHATDLRSALEVCGSEHIAGVLLDLGLPDTSGMDGITRLLDDCPGLPIVVLTGRDDPATVEQAIAAGAQDFLVKSTNPSGELLVRTLRNAAHRAAVSLELIASNQRLGSFASMVAHDLRGPLSIATGMLQVLEMKAGSDLDPDLADLVSRSMGAVNRTTKLVDSLLMYAKAKHTSTDRIPVDLGEVLTWAITALGDALADAVVSVPDALPTVTGDTVALRQVLQNLLSNAVQYADADRPLAIRVTVEEQPDTWVMSIADNGQGIPLVSREVVFDVGERLDRAGDGFGLGLPAVRAAMESQGGSVWIDDGIGEHGVTMRIELPR